jgi:hypothetical protein
MGPLGYGYNWPISGRIIRSTRIPYEAVVCASKGAPAYKPPLARAGAYDSGALKGVELGFTDDCQYKNPRPVAQAEISPFQLLLLP